MAGFQGQTRIGLYWGWHDGKPGILGLILPHRHSFEYRYLFYLLPFNVIRF